VNVCLTDAKRAVAVTEMTRDNDNKHRSQFIFVDWCPYQYILKYGRVLLEQNFKYWCYYLSNMQIRFIRLKFCIRIFISVLVMNSFILFSKNMERLVISLEDINITMFRDQLHTDSRNDSLPPNLSNDRPYRPPVILQGPHDRYNFGDLIFEKVVTKLLIERAGYFEEEILYGGMISVDMSKYGGRPDIESMKKLRDQSHQKGPFDIVYLGGESLACDFDYALRFYSNSTEIQNKTKIGKVSNCAYLTPKEILINPIYKGPENFAILNSNGGNQSKHPECETAVNTSDYKSFRDKDPLFPDSAVAMKYLYNDFILNFTQRPHMQNILKVTNRNFIAVQFKALTFSEDDVEEKKKCSQVLDEVASMRSSTIVFFAAGTAPSHDSFEVYDQISKLMVMPSIVFREENVWSVLSLISLSKAVISTSLHVRIMGFIYQKPRVTWCSINKHKKFIELWEPKGAKCSENYTHTLPDLNIQLNIKSNWTQVDIVVQQYLKNFDAWSNLLIHKERKILYPRIYK